MIAQDTEDQVFGPHQNLYAIAGKKIKAICTTHSPLCNNCGSICDNSIWYKKNMPVNSFTREGESGTIHATLKQITSSYILCLTCFDTGKYPKVLNIEDFEKCSLKSMLEGHDDNFEEPEENWTEEEVEKLVLAVSTQKFPWPLISE